MDSDAPRITGDQIKAITAAIRSGQSDDLIIALQVRVPEEQVKRFRAMGLGCQLKRKGKRK